MLLQFFRCGTLLDHTQNQVMIQAEMMATPIYHVIALDQSGWLSI